MNMNRKVSNAEPSALIAPSQSNPDQPTFKAAQLAGIIIGVVIASVLATVGVFACLRRFKNQKEKDPTSQLPQTQPLTSDLIIAPYPHTTSASNVPGRKKEELLDILQSTQDSQQINAGSQGTRIVRVKVERERRVVHLNDSGWRPSPPRSDEANSSVVLMPPVYDAAV